MSESLFKLVRDARAARRGGPDAIAERQSSRLAELVAHARTRSPLYADLYRELPEQVDSVAHLPITSKKPLMARFDEWCTDREVTVERARAFADDPARVGEKFLDRYTLLTTSGTTGTRGIFILDDRTMAITQAIAFRMLGDWLGARSILRILAKRGRMAMVMASGGHFASAVAAARLKQSRGKRVEILSVQSPVAELVSRLNEFEPALLAPYASMASLLATEQEAGRLRIHPALISVTAEGLPIDEYERIARVFDTRVGNSYAATECTFFSHSCDQWWLHVNADWCIFEPVDADGRAVPPGEPSHTVLITNLANRVQPILRYDLGDSVLVRPDPCPCGSPFPAIRVQGRAADVVELLDERGTRVAVPPLAFATRLDGIGGIELSQVVQTSPTGLRVRLRLAPDAGSDRVWKEVRASIGELLTERGLAHVTVEQAAEPPEQGKGGKYRAVIPQSRP